MTARQKNRKETDKPKNMTKVYSQTQYSYLKKVVYKVYIQWKKRKYLNTNFSF